MDYKLIFEQVRGSYALMTADNFTIVNQSNFHASVVKKSINELIGKTLFECYPSTDENQKIVLSQLNEVLQTKQTVKTKGIQRYDVNNMEKYWSLEYVPVLDSNDEDVEFIILASIDVTNLVKNGLTLYNK